MVRAGATRGIFWLVVLAAAAVAAALLVGKNPGTVSLYWPPYRVDVSFNLVLFLLLVFGGLLYGSLRAMAVLRELPRKARAWRQQQSERAVVGALFDAWGHQGSGRFLRAQESAKSALKALDQAPLAELSERPGWRVMAHALVAESAQALQDKALRDTHMQAALAPQAGASAAQWQESVLLSAARWAIEDRDTESASQRLQDLPQGLARRIQALHLRLRLQRMQGRSLDALETARLLAKHRAFTPDAAASLLRSLGLEALRGAHDTLQLKAAWDRLSPAERLQPALVVVLVQRLRATGLLGSAQAGHADAVPPDSQEALQMALAALAPLWSGLSDLDRRAQAQLAEVMVDNQCLQSPRWLSQAESALARHPDNPVLQFVVGEACLRQRLWGKASLLLRQASLGLADAPDLQRRCWCALAEWAQEQGDPVQALTAWRNAALMAAPVQGKLRG